MMLVHFKYILLDSNGVIHIILVTETSEVFSKKKNDSEKLFIAVLRKN